MWISSLDRYPEGPSVTLEYTRVVTVVTEMTSGSHQREPWTCWGSTYVSLSLNLPRVALLGLKGLPLWDSQRAWGGSIPSSVLAQHLCCHEEHECDSDPVLLGAPGWNLLTGQIRYRPLALRVSPALCELWAWCGACQEGDAPPAWGAEKCFTEVMTRQWSGGGDWWLWPPGSAFSFLWQSQRALAKRDTGQWVEPHFTQRRQRPVWGPVPSA